MIDIVLKASNSLIEQLKLVIRLRGIDKSIFIGQCLTGSNDYIFTGFRGINITMKSFVFFFIN